MTNPVTPASRLIDPIRLIGTNPVEATPVASIVSIATGILREELPTLAANGIGRIPATLWQDAFARPERLDGSVQPLVDALLGFLKVPPDQLVQLIGQIPGVTRPGGERNGQSMRVLRTPHSATAGDLTRLSLHLENDDDQPDECGFYVTDLIGPSGSRLPASHVRVSPNPVRIAGRGSADVQIEVRIPSGTTAGWYTGLLQTDDGEDLRALVQVLVGQ